MAHVADQCFDDSPTQLVPVPLLRRFFRPLPGQYAAKDLFPVLSIIGREFCLAALPAQIAEAAPLGAVYAERRPRVRGPEALVATQSPVPV